MAKQDLTETFVSGGEVFGGRMLKVHCDTVRLPDGRQSMREYVRHPGAVLAVPLFEDGRVLLERQYRYPHGRDFIELPAGKLEPGEPHLETVKRELMEETGYVASEWVRLGVIHPSIGYTDEAIEMFIARGLEKGEVKLDDEEFLECFTVPFDEAITMVRDGRITDGKTIAALLWVRVFGLA